MSERIPPEVRKEIAEQVVAEIAKGQFLRVACREMAPPRDPATVLGWINSDEDLAKRYARARIDGYSLRLEDMEQDSEDLYVKAARGEFPDPTAAVQAFKVMTDVKKWNAGKFASGKFGDKVGVELSGSVKSESDFDLSKLTPEELIALRALQAKAANDAPADA